MLDEILEAAAEIAVNLVTSNKDAPK